MSGMLEKLKIKVMDYGFFKTEIQFFNPQGERRTLKRGINDTRSNERTFYVFAIT